MSGPPPAAPVGVAPVRVAVVDDHALVADGVAALLREEPGVVVVGVARTLGSATSLIEREQPDVVVCDVQLGAESGFSLVDLCPSGRPAFVMYSSHDHASYHRAAFEAGAAAFVLKSADSAELVAAVRTAAAGQRSFPVREPRATRSNGSLPTERELEIIEHIAAGLSNEGIAAALGIQAKTVEGHLRTLFHRVRATSRTELVLRAIEEGWIRRQPGVSSAGEGRRQAEGRRPGGWVADREVLRTRRRSGPTRER